MARALVIRHMLNALSIHFFFLAKISYFILTVLNKISESIITLKNMLKINPVDTFALIDRVNQLSKVSYRLQWDSTYQKWRHETCPRQLRTYYYLSYLFVFGWILVTLCILIALFGSGAAGVRIDVVMLYIFMWNNGALSLVIDTLLHLYGDDFVNFLNWLFPSDKENLDFWTSWAICNIIFWFTAVPAVFLPIFLVHGNWDPAHVIFTWLSNSYFPDIRDFSGNIYFQIWRYVCTTLAYQAFALNVRTICVIVVLIFSRINYPFKKLLSRQRSHIDNFNHEIFQYRQLSTAIASIEGFASYFVASYLIIAFVLLVAGTNMLILSVTFFNIKILTLAIFVTAVNWMFVLFSLEMGCSLSELSRKAVRNWKREISNWPISNDNRFARKTVKSCSPIQFRVAYVGVVDRDIKMNYSRSVTEYIVTTLVVCNDMM